MCQGEGAVRAAEPNAAAHPSRSNGHANNATTVREGRTNNVPGGRVVSRTDPAAAIAVISIMGIIRIEPMSAANIALPSLDTNANAYSA